MKYFTYGYETHKNKKGEITVKAKTEAEAWNRLSDYEVSRGELHYAWLKSVDDVGQEKYYHNDNAEKALALFIAFAGAALGASQVNQYGMNRDFKKCLDDDTLYLIKQ